MKKLIFGFERTSLCLLYTSFIRYDSKVLDSCSLFDSDWLEKNTIATRIVMRMSIDATVGGKQQYILSLIETFYAVY